MSTISYTACSPVKHNNMIRITERYKAKFYQHTSLQTSEYWYHIYEYVYMYIYS